MDDLEEFALPPLKGKTHPSESMDEPKYTIDDPVRDYHHHPNDSGSTEFLSDPVAADAAADLGSDLGRQFLEGATFGEDMSDRIVDSAEASESEMPLLLDADDEGASESAEEVAIAPPSRHQRGGGASQRKRPGAKRSA